MKGIAIVLKILAALAAVAGIIFVIVKYGDKIVAWFKHWFSPFTECDGDCDDCDFDCFEDTPDAEDVEESVVEELISEDAETVVASDTDFEG